ncbi:MAG: hypothetical protein ACTMIR_08960 [Cellulomonadaceae bacterium]
MDDPGALDARACERLFRRNGLPLLIEGHSAGRDVFGRAAPFLLLVLVGQLSGAMNLSWPAWANLLAVVGAVAVVGAGYALLNRARGRPWLTLPQKVDAPELAFFVLVPAVLPLLFGGQALQAAVTAGANAALLALVWLTVRYGLGATLWWGSARIVDELGASFVRLLRLLPLLLVFSLVLFFNAQVWQVFAAMPRFSTLALGIVFAGLILLSLSLRLPGEVRRILADAERRVARPLPTLTRAQRVNVGAMVLTSQVLQILVVSLGIGLFFVVTGVLTLTPEVQQAWVGDPGTSWWTVTVDGTALALTQATVRVSVAIATFTGLYYAISMLTDPVYRTEFADGLTEQLARVVDVRGHYLALAERTGDAT